MCRANNLAGKQQDPCIFHIIAAGKPDPPYNCTMVNMTNESLEVECQEGFDGKCQFFTFHSLITLFFHIYKNVPLAVFKLTSYC